MNDNCFNNPNGRYHNIVNFIDGGKILDYGCGTGFLAEYLAKNGNDVVGIDPDYGSIYIAKKSIGEKDNLHFYNCGIEKVNSDSFDYVVSAEVIEHTFNPGGYLKECNRVLKPQGHLILSTPNNITLDSFILQLFLNKKRLSKVASKGITNDHVQAWDARILVRLALTQGFAYEHHVMCGGIPFMSGYLYLDFPSNLKRTVVFDFSKINGNKNKEG